jgi:hypothetical protein
LLSERDDCDGWFDCACERVTSLLPAVFGADWLVVVPSRAAGVDWAFCVDAVEFAEGVEVEEDGAAWEFALF